MSIEIIPIHALKDNYIWTIVNWQNKTVACVDPGEAIHLIEYLEQHDLVLSAVLVTHHHWDHTNGITKLLQHYDVPVYGPADEAVVGMTVPLQADDQVNLTELGLRLNVLAIPGHTAGHIAYYAPGRLFCGDTLFAGGCGRIFEGTAGQLYNSLLKLAALPGSTLVYCGHEYTEANLRFAMMVEPDNQAIKQRLEAVKKIRSHGQASLPSPLAEELNTNPFLRCEVPEVVASAGHYLGKHLQDPIDVFATLRDWKNRL